MMKRFFQLFLFLFLANFFSFELTAQNRNLTIDQATLGRYREFYPQTLNQLQWRAGDETLTFVDDGGDAIEQIDKISGKKTLLVDIYTLNAVLQKNEIKNLDFFPDFKWVDRNAIAFQWDDHFLIYNVLQKKLEKNLKYDRRAKNVSLSFQNDALAYTLGNNLYLLDKDAVVKNITHDSDLNIVNGNIVSRNEFGINKGIFWSPQGDYLAFYRKDESDVADYPLVDVTQRIATLKNIKYPMAGEKSEHVSLGVYDIKTGKTLFIENDKSSEQYLTNISWDPSEKYIYIAVLNREQNHLWLNKYEVSTGQKVKNLFEETDNRYVEPLNPLYFLKAQPDEFIWQSRRDGYNHLYLYTTEGKLLRQLTSGPWEVLDLYGEDVKSENIFFASTKESPLDRQTYKVKISSGNVEALTSVPGTHHTKFDAAGNLFVDQYNSTSIPNKIEVCNTKGKRLSTLLTAPNKLADSKLGEETVSTLKSADGTTDLYYRLVKPVDFDPHKKYPVVVYVYGGPHDQLVTNEWHIGIDLWQQYMAGKGYVCFMMDNRGSSNRGMAFESVIHRHLGQNEMADQMKGVEFLKSLPYVDSTRIGVHGWSFGGFMTTSLMLHHPETFKVGVAGGPVIDWKYYEVMYGERYMDMPQENPEGYQQCDLKNYVQNLKGKLLIIHGCLDSTVVWQHSLTFLKACIDNKVLVDYFVYPTHEHNVRGTDRIHLMRKVTEYFDEYLK